MLDGLVVLEEQGPVGLAAQIVYLQWLQDFDAVGAKWGRYDALVVSDEGLTADGELHLALAEIEQLTQPGDPFFPASSARRWPPPFPGRAFHPPG